MPAAKKKQKKKTASQQPVAFELFARLVSDDYRPARRSAAIALCVSLVGAACVFGLFRLRNHVHHLTHFERVELWIDWENLPPFLQSPSYAPVLRELEHQVALTANDRVLDESLAQRIAASLDRTELGWVKGVNRVIVRPNGRVSVDCEFRYPRAFVSWAEHCYLVDEDGVRLPGEYTLRECSYQRGLMVRGVEAPNPPVGHFWPGEDLAAGLQLARMLAGQPYRNQVASISVENFEGRITNTQPHLVIATDRAGSRIWWGRAPDQEMGVENSAEQKLALLRRLYDRYGRIDINRPFVDIRSFRDSISMPTTDLAAGTN